MLGQCTFVLHVGGAWSRLRKLLQVFSATSGFNIGYILAQTPKASGARERPLQTVTPLAQSLGLTVDISWCVSTQIMEMKRVLTT